MTRDVNGRECRPGDLIRIFHYRDRSTGRNCYMHKLVVLVNDDREISRDGRYFFAVSVTDIWDNGTDKAHKCGLSQCGDFEIINGLSRTLDSGFRECWYDRPKVKGETDE